MIHWHSKRLIIATAVLCAALLAPQFAAAGVITTHEAEMDAVFSQGTFGTSTVDIRFLPNTTIIAPSLLVIDNDAELDTLFNTFFGGGPTVYMYFVDSILSCGGLGPGIVGCANRPGNDMVLRSSFVVPAGDGTEVASHELGHNLGLGHVAAANLMTGTINGNTDLTAGQVTTILASGLIQLDAGQRFIEIQPVLVAAAAAVPEPSSLVLLATGAIGLIGYRRRRRKQAA